jgi:hypothetical protein
MMILTSKSVILIMAKIASHDLDKLDIQYNLNNTLDSQNHDKELTADARSIAERSPCPCLFQILITVDYPPMKRRKTDRKRNMRELTNYADIFRKSIT